MRIFITGVTGSGKTTLLNSLSKDIKYNGSKFLNFDSLVDYSIGTENRLGNLYSLLYENNSFIIDALPFLEGNDFDKFINYLDNTPDIPSVLYIVFCEKNFWLKNRVPLKKTHLESIGLEAPSVEEYSLMYNNFFSRLKQNLIILKPYFKEIIAYDSCNNNQISFDDFQLIYFGN
jgi:hypothetical protein